MNGTASQLAKQWLRHSWRLTREHYGEAMVLLFIYIALQLLTSRLGIATSIVAGIALDTLVTILRTFVASCWIGNKAWNIDQAIARTFHLRTIGGVLGVSALCALLMLGLIIPPFVAYSALVWGPMESLLERMLTVRGLLGGGVLAIYVTLLAFFFYALRELACVICVQRAYGVKDSLRLGWRLVRENYWTLKWFFFYFSVLALLCTLCFVLPLFFIFLPLTLPMYVVIHQSLTENKV